MVGTLQPLSQNFQIVGEDGKPTIYFINWTQQRQKDIGTAVDTDTVSSMISTAFANRKVIAGTDLTGGGSLSTDVTINHAPSGVTAGTYGSSTKVPQITVDPQGHISAVTEVAISGGGGGGFALIQEIVTVGTETTVSTATITQAYKDLIVSLSGTGKPGGSVNLYMQVNADTGANYNYYRWNVFGNANGNNQTFMDLFVASGDIASGELTIAGYSSTSSRKGFTSHGSFIASTGVFPGLASGEWLNTSAVTSLQFFWQDGSAFPVGTVIRVYGRG